MATKSIDNFISAIANNGGMAMSNGYDVEFEFGNENLKGLVDEFKKLSIRFPSTNDDGTPGSLINMFCSQAQLPNISAAVSQINGRYLGEGVVNFPHTRIVSDFSLTWMCDANMAPFKFLNAWHSYIFGENVDNRTANRLQNIKEITAPLKKMQRSNRLKFPNQYQATLRIAKTERGKNAPNSRVPLVCLLENVFPYAIDVVPLSYGSSQISEVSANFYYTRHTYYNLDIRKFNG